jgi:hypothetical protein
MRKTFSGVRGAFWGALAAALVISAAPAIAGKIIAGGNESIVPVAADGGTASFVIAPGGLGGAATPMRVDPVGTTTQPGSEVPQCFSDVCTEIAVPAAGKPDGGDFVANLTPSAWYEITVIADGSGGLAGCWDNGSRIVTPTDAGNPCFGLPKLKDGQVKPVGWPATPGNDAGVARVWFYASVTGGYTITLCPQVACR